MSALTETREEFAALVADATGLRKYAFVPEKVTESAVIVVPESPYLTPGPTFGKVTVRFAAVLALLIRDNETTTNRLDTAVENAYIAVLNSGWTVDDISDPVTATFGGENGPRFLTVTITATAPVAL